jgi:pyruvate dehydrogenase E2 component (dihydrolipoamide acetyltransferase)
VPVADGAPRGETEISEPARAERLIGRRAAESRATIPDLELGAEIEMTAALAAGERFAASSTALLVRACALALRHVPFANGAFRDGRFELYSRINVAFVVSAGRAQLAPTVVDADRKPLSELASEVERLTERALAGDLTPPDLSGATFTVSDLGRFEVDRPGIVIPGGQAAAVAAGAIREAPVVRDGLIVPGQMMSLTLACDHRILYGAEAARFLGRIKRLLQEGNL